MNGSVVQTWMSDVLHAITQGLLVPDIALLIAFIAYALFCIGSIVAEFFTERRHFKVVMPKFLAALMAAEEGEIPEVIQQSGLLKRQKIALLTVYDYRMLPGDALIALIKRLVGEEESRFDRIAGRNNMAARVSPMLGLMGTLIPLGPGIQALGKADTELLSSSLLIAFDTTVAGLVVAAVCLIVGKIRGNWYANYMSALDSGMATMLQKIEDMRAQGKIAIQEPSDYAFLFQKSVGRKADAGETAKEGEDASAPADAAAGTSAGASDASKEPAAPQGQPAAVRAAVDPAAGEPGTAAAAGAADGLEARRDAPAGTAAADAAEAAQQAQQARRVQQAWPAQSQQGSEARQSQQAAGQSAGTSAQPQGASQLTGSLAPDQPRDPWLQSLRQPAPTQATTAFPASSQLGTGASVGMGTPAAASAGAGSSVAGAVHPLQASAPFSPVPDPTFIADLASASAQAQAFAGQTPATTVSSVRPAAGGSEAARPDATQANGAQGQPYTAQPVAATSPALDFASLEAQPASRRAQASGWYQPQANASASRERQQR